MAGPTKPTTARLGTAKASSWVLDFAIPKMAGPTVRLGIAEPTVRVAEPVKTTTVRLGIAKAGTRVLNFAIPKAEGGGAYEHDDGEARFGKFDDEGWRILQNDDSGQKQASVLNCAILKV